MTLKPIWRFRRMGRDEPGIDPVQEEFFDTEELEDLNGALVREAIQNSLDAFAAALAKTRKAELVTGDPEFKPLEKDIKVLWLNA